MKAHGVRVQKSVFECSRISEEQFLETKPRSAFIRLNHEIHESPEVYLFNFILALQFTEILQNNRRNSR